jgi:hypothetical protein
MREADWLSTSQVAACLEVSSARVRQMLAAGQIAHWPTPIGRLIAREEAERLAEERRGRHAERRAADPEPAA